MKIDENKLTISLLSIFLIMVSIASIKLIKTPTIDIKGTEITVEEYLGENEEIISYEIEAKEDDEKEDLAEKEEKNIISATSTPSEKKSIIVKDKKENKINSTSITEEKPSSKGSNYTVKAGDTLFLIAQRTNISVKDLKSFNNLDSDIIYAGQVLKTSGASSAKNVASAKPAVSRGDKQRDEDIYWLSRIIHAEAQGETYQGKVAVGNVVLNRVRSSKFPNSIYGVIFDKKDGYTQFSPVIDGTIYNTPNSDSVRAAKEALGGAKPVGEALYFLNPQKSTNFWIVANRKHMTTIGKHDFYY